MQGKRTPPTLIDPEEIVELCLSYATIDTGNVAAELVEHYNRKSPYTGRYRTFCLLATLYEAGRIQGMREERAKRKPRVSTLQA